MGDVKVYLLATDIAVLCLPKRGVVAVSFPERGVVVLYLPERESCWSLTWCFLLVFVMVSCVW